MQEASRRFKEIGRSRFFSEHDAVPIFNNLFLAYRGFFQVSLPTLHASSAPSF